MTAQPICPAFTASTTRRSRSDCCIAMRDARRLGRVAQRQRRRPILEHRLHELGILAQERVLEALVERRRAFVAHAVRVRDHDVVEAAFAADGDSALGADHLGQALEAVRHRARRVDRRDLAGRELAGRDAVVDVARIRAVPRSARSCPLANTRDGATGPPSSQRAASMSCTLMSAKMPPLDFE